MIFRKKLNIMHFNYLLSFTARSIQLGAVLIAMALHVFAAERLSPMDFSDEIGQLWVAENYVGIEVRVDEVYSAYPDFIPAIVVASFVDGVFRGKIYESQEKISVIKEFLDEYTEEVNSKFVEAISVLLDMAN